MIFQAEYDRTAKVISAVVLLLVAGAAAASRSLIVGAAIALLLLVAWGFSVSGYAVADGWLIVKRPLRSLRIPLAEIRLSRAATAADLRGMIRLWGSGGFFGWFGIFRTSALGVSTWYVTDRNKIVVLITGGRTVLVSPADREGFLSAIPASAAATGTAHSNPWRAWLPAAAAIAGTAVIIGSALLYSPGAPRVTVTNSALTIDDRFYPVTLKASEVDVARVRIVDLDRSPEWRPTLRTNGFANSRYRAGWFRLANGEKVRLYSTGSRRLVLVPPKAGGTAVLIEAADPQALIAAIDHAWARN